MEAPHQRHDRTLRGGRNEDLVGLHVPDGAGRELVRNDLDVVIVCSKQCICPVWSSGQRVLPLRITHQVARAYAPPINLYETGRVANGEHDAARVAHRGWGGLDVVRRQRAPDALEGPADCSALQGASQADVNYFRHASAA